MLRRKEKTTIPCRIWSGTSIAKGHKQTENDLGRDGGCRNVQVGEDIQNRSNQTCVPKSKYGRGETARNRLWDASEIQTPKRNSKFDKLCSAISHTKGGHVYIRSPTPTGGFCPG